MLTIQTLENIKKGSRLTWFNGIYAVIYGLLHLIFINLIIKMNFKAVDSIWQVFVKYNPQISFLYLKLMILRGIFIIIIGIIIIYLSSYILKKKDKRAWAALFIVGLIFWATLLALDIMDKNLYLIIASLIGWISFIIGMLMPLRYYLQREYPEY